MGISERMRNMCGKKGVGLKGTMPHLYKEGRKAMNGSLKAVGDKFVDLMNRLGGGYRASILFNSREWEQSL